jgi:hypothetical protein
MKLILSAILLICAMTATVSFAEEDGDDIAVQNCIKHWRDNPFKEAHPHFRVIASSVRVLGIGDEIKDDVKSPNPELILIKPNVTVLAKTTLELMNPNGWYCLKTNVAVLGKTVINLNCKANLASSKDGATVLGGSDTGGVTVLGAARVNRRCL